VNRCRAASESDCRCLHGILITPALAGDFQTQGAFESVHTISRKTGSPLTRTFRRPPSTDTSYASNQNTIHRQHESPKLHPGSTIHPQTHHGRPRGAPKTSSLRMRDRSPASRSRIPPPSDNFKKALMKHTPNSCRATHLSDSVPFCDVRSAMYNLLRQQYSPTDFGDENPAVSRALETINAVCD